jgi:hypothetical protein
VVHLDDAVNQPASLRSDTGPLHRNHRTTSLEYAPSRSGRGAGPIGAESIQKLKAANA